MLNMLVRFDVLIVDYVLDEWKLSTLAQPLRSHEPLPSPGCGFLIDSPIRLLNNFLPYGIF